MWPAIVMGGLMGAQLLTQLLLNRNGGSAGMSPPPATPNFGEKPYINTVITNPVGVEDPLRKEFLSQYLGRY